MADDWRRRARHLADDLLQQGLSDPAWIRAFAAAPRHLFAPRGLTIDAEGAVVDAAKWSRAELLRQSYADQVLVTRFVDTGNDAFGEPVRLATSSASQPLIVAIMLELLNVVDGHRVCEIGTGPGYNACLLCLRLGDGAVTSIDLQADVVEEARRNLAEAGHRPLLIAGDGAAGHPAGAPYDRIIATCAVPRIPPAWPAQLAANGRIVAPMTFGGALAVLDRDGEATASGRFSREGGFFMAMRGADGGVATPDFTAEGPGRVRDTDAAPLSLGDLDFRLWLELSIPELTWRSMVAGDGTTAVVRLFTQDGLVVLNPKEATVAEYGRPLWDDIETCHRRWVEAGRPPRDRLGLSVTPYRQWVWLDEPDSAQCWQLSPAG